ncbi:MAG TPA: cation transporter [Clostridia bacterium]|nr:cation transporter [Clostridia bacterium]
MDVLLKRKYENMGLKFSIGSNLLFVVLEIWISYLSNSKAVLIDGLFDGCEAILLLFSIRLMKYLYKPISEKRPIGYSNLEPFYMILKGLLFFVIAAMMALNGISSFFSGGYEVDMNIVFYFELFAGLYGIAAFLILKYLNSKARSKILDLEIKEWILDIVTSFGTGIAFLTAFLIRFTAFSSLSRYFDQIITLAMVVYILPTPLKAIKSGFQELFFLSPSEEMLQKVKSIGEDVTGTYGISKDQLEFDVVKTGRRLWISVYIEIKQNYIELSLLKDIHSELEQKYAGLADLIDVDVIPDF